MPLVLPLMIGSLFVSLRFLTLFFSDRRPSIDAAGPESHSAVVDFSSSRLELGSKSLIRGFGAESTPVLPVDLRLNSSSPMCLCFCGLMRVMDPRCCGTDRGLHYSDSSATVVAHCCSFFTVGAPASTEVLARPR